MTPNNYGGGLFHYNFSLAAMCSVLASIRLASLVHGWLRWLHRAGVEGQALKSGGYTPARVIALYSRFYFLSST